MFLLNSFPRLLLFAEMFKLVKHDERVIQETDGSVKAVHDTDAVSLELWALKVVHVNPLE